MQIEYINMSNKCNIIIMLNFNILLFYHRYKEKILIINKNVKSNKNYEILIYIHIKYISKYLTMLYCVKKKKKNPDIIYIKL